LGIAVRPNSQKAQSPFRMDWMEITQAVKSLIPKSMHGTLQAHPIF
jgi:hypothetical protein